MALQIRKTTYRGQEGFLICGRDPEGRGCRIFTKTRESAERIRERKKRGEEIAEEDWNA